MLLNRHFWICVAAVLLIVSVNLAQTSILPAPLPPMNPPLPPGIPAVIPANQPTTFIPVIPANNPVDVTFGLPLTGLTGAEVTDFNNGKVNFQVIETVSSGLGPIFNGDSCVACHSVPAIGGSSNVLVTRFGNTSGGNFDPLTSLGGSLLHSYGITPSCVGRVPPQSNTIARRQSIALFGDGLIEAIPDATIIAGVRTTPVDGILGRAAMIVDVATGKTRVGRFGWKNQQATLLSFAGDAYLNELGITNSLFPVENAPEGYTAMVTSLNKLNDVPALQDTVDPDGKADINRFSDFMQLLEPPPTTTVPPVQPFTASTTIGAKLFVQIGCSNCHTPVLNTGPNSIAALSNKPVALYSDLLLHNMGHLNDGIAQGDALPTEMKTPPLWGVRASAPYLHDGRAPDLSTAIKLHDGEATIVKGRYLQLTPGQQLLLVQFLNSI